MRKTPKNQRKAKRPVLGLLAAILLAGAIGAPVAHAAQDPNFGLNIQSLVNWKDQWTDSPNPPPWDPYFQAMQNDGIGIARMDAAWRDVQPSASTSLSDASSWSKLDEIAGTLALRGIRWEPVIDLVPFWAQVGNPPGQGFNKCPDGSIVIQRYLPPASKSQFATYAGDVAKRYGAGGDFWKTWTAAHPDLPALPVKQYEIWNEENADAYWNNKPDPADYLAMYNPARTAIHSYDPSAQVLVGGIVWGGQVNCQPDVTNDDTFIKGLFTAGGTGWKPDGIAIHPYAPVPLGIVANVRREQKALQAAGHASDVPLEQTEMGWPFRPDNAPADSDAATYPTDNERSGTLSLVADMLAGSDCGIQDFIGYTAVERETTMVNEDAPATDPYDLVEHWMGVYRAGATTGTPAAGTVASTAMAAVIARDQAGDFAGHDIQICGAPGAPGHVLAVGLTATPTSTAGCFTAHATYRGFPLTGAQLYSGDTYVTASGDSPVGPSFTDQAGDVPFCGPTNHAYAVHVVVGGGGWDPDQVPLVGQSPDTPVCSQCDTTPPPTTTTTTTTTPPPPATTTGSTPPPPGGPGTTTTTPGGPQPPVVTACVLQRFSIPTQHLKTVARDGLRAVVQLSSIASTGSCSVTLTASRRVSSGSRRATRDEKLGTVTAILKSTGAQTLKIKLSKAERARIRKLTRAQTTVRLTLPQAPIGAQATSASAVLKR